MCSTTAPQTASASSRGRRSVRAGSLGRSLVLEETARRHKVTPSQLALAWLLKRSPVMLPIPGTSKVAHLDENTAAADIVLSDDEFAALDDEGKAAA